MTLPSRNCPFCRSEIGFDEDVFACPECQILYHRGCWDENSGCAKYGCEGKADEKGIVITADDINAVPISRPMDEPSEEPFPEEPPNPNYDDTTGCDKIMGVVGWCVIIFFVFNYLKECS